MPNNKLSRAVKLTTAALALGVASQASAFEINAGNGITASIYGYARLNAVYDIDEDIGVASGTQGGDFSKVNTGADEDNEVTGHFDADAVQTRIGVKTTLPQGVNVVVEGDFRGGTESGGIVRLRHAYGEYNGVLMGRTWSNYNSFVGNTSVLEFDGIAGNAGYQNRKAQVRYTTGPLSFSVEDSVGAIAEGTRKSGLPTLTARYESNIDSTRFSTAALVHQVTHDDGVNDDSALGFAVFGATKIALTDTLSIQGVLNYTDGANRYLWRSGSNYYGEDAYLVNGDVETITGYGGNIGASLKVGPGSVNVAIGMVEMDWDDAVDDGLAVGDKHERNTNAMLNYQWKPVQSVNLGVQYSHFRVKKVNGDDGDANRVMFAAQYNF